MRHLRWEKIAGLGAAFVLSVGVGITATSVLADDDSPTPEFAAVRRVGEDCLSAAGLDGFEVTAKDRRFWDEARYASETGWGVVPEPYPAQTWVPGKRHRAKIEACARQSLAATPEARASKARADLLVAASPAVAANFSDPDEYLASLPEVAEALKRWSACMAEQGLSLATPGDAVAHVQDQVEALGELPPIPLMPLDRAVGKPDAQDKRIHAFWEELEPRLAELAAEEREIAVASVECKRRELYPTLIALAEE